MRITYDSEADALYIELRYEQADDNMDIEEGVSADLDKDGHVIGFEILDASKRMTPEELYQINGKRWDGGKHGRAAPECA